MKRLPTVLAGLLFCMQAAQAHTQLESSMPADGATLEAAPAEIALTFSEQVRLTALSLEGEGAEQDLGPLPREMTAQFSVAAPELESGSYVLTWRAMSADTHVLTGAVRFSVE